MKRRKSSNGSDFVPEWSRTVNADDITERIRVFTLTADEEECITLARRFGISSIQNIRADMTACRDRNEHVVHVEGFVRADLVQPCVVTLEPVTTSIDEKFEGWFADPKDAVSFARARAERLRRKGAPDVALLDEEEDPEPITNGIIDLGELAAQYIALAIPPYPRAPGAGGEKDAEEENEPLSENSLRKSPFAALKAWKAEKEKEEDGGL